MKENLFEDFYRKKELVKSLAIKAFENGWIDESRKAEIIGCIEKDILTIGVIGQMKCGKSTFINSFVFEDDILPAATTPMTAALTKITYGTEKKVKAEFYTEDEWLSQEEMARRSLNEVKDNPLLESKIKAAKELVEKAKHLGNSLDSYFGKTQEDSFVNLKNYVGADGKFVSITKAVTIYYPKEYLKGVEIVDTPGFNDPIVSREERTKEFLNRAHVVILMLYAGCPFNATDRSILFKNVCQCGIGKVLIGINKYDIPYENGETEGEIIDFVTEQISKACHEESYLALVDTIQDTPPITISAEMALLSQLPMSKIKNSYQHGYKRHCEIFEVSSQSELREKSHIDNLICCVRTMIEKEKESILSAKSINAILAAGYNKRNNIKAAIRICKSTISDCSASDDELKEKQKVYERVTNSLQKKIELLGGDLDSKFKKIIRKSKNILEEDFDDIYKKLDRLIDDIGKMDNFSKIESKWKEKITHLKTRTITRHIEECQENAYNDISSIILEFITNTEEFLKKHVDKYIDIKDLIKDLSQSVNFKDIIIDEKQSNSNNEKILIQAILNNLFEFENVIMLGVPDKIVNVFNHKSKIKELKEKALNIKKTNVEEYLESIIDCRKPIIDSIKKNLFDNYLTKIQENLSKIINEIHGRELKLKEETEKLNQLEADLQKVESQIEEIQNLVQQ